MKFSRKGQLGELGESRVKLYLNEHFGFVCNSYEGKKDIGIDLEIHVTDLDRTTATGGTLKAQVKTTESMINEDVSSQDGFRFFLDQDHVDYWVGLQVTVILILVSKYENRIWWKEVSSKNDCIGPLGGWSVQFTPEDELTIECRSRLFALAEISNASFAKLSISDAAKIFETADLMFDQALERGPLNVDNIREIRSILKETEPLLQEAKVLLQFERRDNQLLRDTITSFNQLCNSIQALLSNLVVGRTFYIDRKRGIDFHAFSDQARPPPTGSSKN